MQHKEQFTGYLQERLNDRREKGLLRKLVRKGDAIDFSSNDYFGFSVSSHNNVSTPAPRFGGTGARSITGNCAEAEDAESAVAAFHRQEAALIFNSGYMANVGLFSCLASRGDTYISDEYIHASIIDGMRLSHASRVKFRHNDVDDLRRILSQVGGGRKFVAVESVYSMDGDEAPLREIAEICREYEALLIVDEAHATGYFGGRGEGLVCAGNLEQDVFACVYTFGKALGLHGAAVAGSAVLKEYLVNHARSFIFTTALPPEAYLQIANAYRFLPGAKRDYLRELIDYFRDKSERMTGIRFLQSRSPIQGVMVGDNFQAAQLAQHLQQNNLFVRAILSPTVPAGLERIRICLHSFNTRGEVDQLMDQIKNFYDGRDHSRHTHGDR
jgi:8-amino-7-oxononanoate synthase